MTTPKKTSKKSSIKKKTLSRAHRRAISDGRKHPLLRLAEDDRNQFIARMIGELQKPITGRELATRLGVSHTLLYGALLPMANTDVEALRERAGRHPTITEIHERWWTTPLREENGTQTARRAMMEVSASGFEAEVAAILYWHCWGTRCAPTGPWGEGPHNRDWANPVGTVLGILSDEPLTKLPTDEALLAAPAALKAFAAHLAGRVTMLPGTTSSREYDLKRAHAAYKWLVKLIDLGDTTAAEVFAVAMHRATHIEVGHALTIARRTLCEREEKRRSDQQKGIENKSPVLDDGVYQILSRAE